MEPTENKTPSGYGKKPLWQWILIYVVIGAIIYGVGYYFLAGKKGSNNYNTTVAPSEVPSVTSEAMSPSKMTVTLMDENNSGESGTATIEEKDGKVEVAVALTGFPTDGVPQPAHIHVGECPGVGEVKYPLTDIVNGKSVTAVPVTLDELKNQLPLAINVHQSKADISTYVSCGELPIQ